LIILSEFRYARVNSAVVLSVFLMRMSDSCAPFRVLLDGLADGEIEPSRVEPHLAACAACRAELEAVRALQARLARLRLPSPPRRAAPPRRAVAAAALAAGLLLAVGVTLGAPPPPLFALSAKLHDDVRDGRVTLRDLGIPADAKPADYAGRCPCPPSLAGASPFIVHRLDGVQVSLLALDAPAAAPDVAVRVGEDTLLSERRGSLRLIWIAPLPLAELRRAAERLRPAVVDDLRALTCAACCALLEGRGRKVDGPVSLELLRVDRERLSSLRELPLAP
jgi:hypothetical protein